jgi:hypothetical protein
MRRVAQHGMLLLLLAAVLVLLHEARHELISSSKVSAAACCVARTATGAVNAAIWAAAAAVDAEWGSKGTIGCLQAAAAAHAAAHAASDLGGARAAVQPARCD